MIEFIIKSTNSLGILFLLYQLFLKDLKTFWFNRYFLLGSLIFSLLMPLISIPVDFKTSTLSQSGEVFKTISSTMVQLDENITVLKKYSPEPISILQYLYGFVSLILLGRFSINLLKIIGAIRVNPRIRKPNHWLVLVNYPTLPFTFFNYVFVSKDEYESDTIDHRILLHEITHAKQFHTVDIIIFELLKVFMWVNPFVWLMKRPIQLNHEYLADNSVLIKNDTSEYQHILINLVFGNSTGTLTSNFDFSLTKQRLKMMTRQFSLKQAIVNILTSSILVFFLGSTLAFSNKDFEYKLTVDGTHGNYAKKELKYSDFAVMEITTNKKRIKVEKFEITLARGKRAVRLDAIVGNSFDLNWYSKRARDGDRIVIEIKKLSDKNIELTQYNSIITIPIKFDN